MPLADRQIEEKGCVTPFRPRQESPATVSFGASSYGYDVRLGHEFLVPYHPNDDGNLAHHPHPVLDPKTDNAPRYRRLDLLGRRDDYVLLPGGYVLGTTEEVISVPRGCLGIVTGKSTYTRLGVLVNCTPLEPEWTGKVTMSLANVGRLPVRLHLGEGIAQVIFLVGDDVCATSYADRKGRYQNAAGAELSKPPGG